MHNEAGAFSETRHVYEPAVKLVWERRWAPRFLSLGLGLGYHEILLAAHSPTDDWECDSYESDGFLRESFLSWVEGAPGELGATYDWIATSWGGADARLRLRSARAQGRWRLHAALQKSTPLNCASMIFFDAFSRATSPELWDAVFLASFLARAAARSCVFATYASTGPLKRALREAGFVLRERRGFGRKRECTFAVRE